MADIDTVEDYLASLPEDRRVIVEEVRQVILEHLPEGYVEDLHWGMVTYSVPLERYPDTYNRQPLGLAALASRKRHLSLYLMCVYTDEEEATRFRERWAATGRKLDMGKSCVRFRRIEDLPLDLIADTIASTPVDELIARYERVRAG